MRTSAPRILLIAVLLLLATATSASAATMRFTGSGDWNNAANWTDAANPAVHVVPTAVDDAEIPSNRSASLSSGAAGAVRSLRVEGSLTVNGRDLDVGGGAASALAGNLTLTNTTLGLGGATTWSDGSWFMNNSTVENAGSLTVTGDVATSNQGGSPVVRNTGTITRDDAVPASGALSFSAPLLNDGQFTLADGRVDLFGAEQASTGTFTLGAGTTLATGASQGLGAGGDVTGAGTLHLDSGTFSVPAAAGTFDPGLVELSGGTLGLGKTATVGRLTSDAQGGTRNGTGTLSAGGPTVLDGVTFAGGGITNLSGPAVETRQLSLNGGSTLNLLAGTTTTWETGSWFINNSTVANAGTLNVTGDVATSNQGGSPLVRNTGTITRADATPSGGTLSFGTGLLNEAQFSVADGRVDLFGAEQPNTGTFTVGAGATLAAGASQALAAGGDVTGAGTLHLDSGTFSVPAAAGTFDPAVVELSGGTLGLGKTATVGRLTSDAQGGTRNGTGTLNAGGPTVLDGVTFAGGGITNLSGPASRRGRSRSTAATRSTCCRARPRPGTPARGSSTTPRC